MVNLRRATRLSQELCPRPDQSPRRNGEHHPQPSRAVVDHIMELAAPRREHLGNRAEMLLGKVEVKPFDRLAQLPIYHPTHHLGLANCQLEALPAHQLDQDRQRQLASTLDLPGVRAVRREHPNGDIADHLKSI